MAQETVLITDGRPEDEERHVEDVGTLSPSQIDTYHDCERKWAFIYISHIRPPAQGGAALGTLVHKQAENYLSGKPLDFTVPGHAADILTSGLQHLPAPGPELEIEKAFKFQAQSGIWYRGFVDLSIPPQFRSEYVPLIHDHKSTKSIKRWAKTPEVLEKDSQAIIYSKSAFIRWPLAEHVDLQWLYMQTEGPRDSKLVPLRLSREHVEKEFKRIDLDGQKILTTLKTVTNPLDVRPRVSACKKFGGCPFMNKQCVLSPSDYLAATMAEAKEKQETTPMNFLAALATPPGTQTCIPTPTPAPAAEAPKSTNPFFVNLPPAAAQVPPMPKSDQPINPPEFQPPPPSGQAAIDAAVATVSSEAASGTTDTAKPRGRGRPPGSKNKAPAERTLELPTELASAAKALSVETPAASLASPSADAGAPSSGSLELRMPFTLYIDCLPIAAGSYVHAETYFARAVAEIKEKVPGAEGWRVGPSEVIGYGKGAELLSARVAEIAKERNRNVVLDTKTPEGAACKAALMALTTSVVMGFR